MTGGTDEGATPKNRKAVCYILIIGIYNFLIALIASVANFGLKQYPIEWFEWDIYYIWAFWAGILFLGLILLYTSPFFAKWLEQKLNDKIENLKRSTLDQRNKDKQHKKEDKQAKKAEKKEAFEKWKSKSTQYGEEE